jgi:nitrate/TMAO reductase-like tetraheme cytochrome c subunit
VVKGDGAVPRQTCWTCHNQPAQIDKYGETKLLHEQHITEHKVECSSCHIKIEHNLTAATKKGLGVSHASLGSDTCATCHEQTHGGPAEMYRGIGGRGDVPEMPSPMSRARVSCIACHKERQKPASDAQFAGQTYLAAQESCDGCHGTKYAGVLEEWRSTVNANLLRAEAALLKAREAAEGARSLLTAEDQLKVSRLLDDADYNVRFVRLAHGVHNVNYATAVLNAAVECCERVNVIIGDARSGAPGGGAR